MQHVFSAQRQEARCVAIGVARHQRPRRGRPRRASGQAPAFSIGSHSGSAVPSWPVRAPASGHYLCPVRPRLSGLWLCRLGSMGRWWMAASRVFTSLTSSAPSRASARMQRCRRCCGNPHDPPIWLGQCACDLGQEFQFRCGADSAAHT